MDGASQSILIFVEQQDQTDSGSRLRHVRNDDRWKCRDFAASGMTSLESLQ